MPDHALEVSIIIAARDAASTIGATLRSLASERAVVGEILLVDDASKDGTVAVAMDAAAKLALPLVVLNVDFRNPGACRNAGIAGAKGEFLYLLDADDEAVEGGLRSLLDGLRTNPGAAMAIGGYIRRTDGRRDKTQIPRPYSADRSANARRYLVNKLRTIAIGSALVRRDAVGRIRFSETLRFEEDALFWAALLTNGDVVAVDRIAMIYNFADRRSLARLTAHAREGFPGFCEELDKLRAMGIADDVLRWRKCWVAFRIGRAFAKVGDAHSAREFIRVAATEPRILLRLLASRYSIILLRDYLVRLRAPALPRGKDAGDRSVARGDRPEQGKRS